MQRPMIMLIDAQSPAALADHINAIDADVVIAPSVDEAVALASGRTPNAAVLHAATDSSVAALCRAFSAHPSLGAVPFVAVGSTVVQAQQAFAHGAADFWREPLEASQLQVGIPVLLSRGLPRPLTSGEPQTILVADDDLFFLRRVSDLLEAAGYRTLQARSGTEALSLLERSQPRPSLCVMDLFMPGVGGIELVQTLRDNPAWANIPVIVVSGVRRDRAVVDELARLGVTDFIDKAMVAIDSVAAIAGEYLSPRAARRRSLKRVSTLALTAFRRVPEEPWLTGLVTNISAGGAFIRTLAPPREGTLVHLRLELGPAASRLVTRGRVAWTRTRDQGSADPHGMGVEFTEFGDEDSRVLEQWIAQGSLLPVELQARPA